MPESTARAQQLFEFCYKLYLDPIYHYICFATDERPNGRLTKEQFAHAWQTLSGSRAATEIEAVRAALTRVIDTMRALSPVEQNVLLLRYGSELPYAQIAEQVQRSAEACHVIHYRALSEFCDRLNTQAPSRRFSHA